MNRIVQYVNFAGVLFLACLCVFQWRTGGDLYRQVAHFQSLNHDQSDKLSGQDKTIQSNAAEMDDLKQKLADSQKQLLDTQTKLVAVTADRDRMANQTSQLRSAIDQWSKAITERDQAIHKLITDRDAAIKSLTDAHRVASGG